MSITSSYDNNDNLKVSIQPSITGSSIWKTSENFCGFNGNEWVLAPESGKVLYITKTKLDFSKDVTFNQPCGFQILVGQNIIYNKIYLSIWDFIKECDEYSEYSEFNRFSWDYLNNPILLKSSIQMSFKVILPNNGIPGTNCFLCIKCISNIE